MPKAINLFFFLFCTVFLSASALAKKREPVSIDWQLPGQWGDTGKSPIRFRAQAFHSQKKDHLPENQSFSEDITVAGRVGQSFIVCARQVESDGFIQTSTSVDTNYVHLLTLTNNTGQLTINDGKPCPEALALQYPYDLLNQLRSTEPFLIIRKGIRKEKSHDDESQLPALPSDPFVPKKSLITTTGAGSGFDDYNDFNNDFKRPPFIPMPDKAMANIILLPTLSLPANWREYQPFAGMYHWLVDQPEAQAGITLLLRFDGHPDAIRLRISQAEYQEMAEHLLSARRLLRWLAPKLDGRAAFIQQLMEIADTVSETLPLWDALWDVETLSDIQQQLMVVLEQPDTEFSLEFETHLLTNTLSEFSRGASPEAGILQLPKEKEENKLGQLPSDQSAGQSSKQDQSDGRQPNQAGGRGQGSDGEDSQEPRQPPGAQSASGSGKLNSADYFTITVNDVPFHIRKLQLSPHLRGQEDACIINAHRRKNPDESLPLNKIEEAVGVEKRNRCSTYNKKALSYLLAYGESDTLRALQHFLPDQ